MWLVDGKNVSQDHQFLLQDGLLWIVNVSKALNGKYITYRAVMDNGSTSEANCTVKVTYGPEVHLQFSPNKAHYILNSGETMPEVSCFVYCNPVWTISWDKFSKGHILSLGKVSLAMAGDYICMATRLDLDISVNRTLTVHVTDNSAFIIAIAVTASFLTTIFLGLCGLFIYMRSGTLALSSCLKISSSQKPDANTAFSENENNLLNAQLEHYEMSNSGSRDTAHYEDVQFEESSPDQNVELYINTNTTWSQL